LRSEQNEQAPKGATKTMKLHELRADEHTWHILEERARDLATQIKEETIVDQGEEVLIFRLGEGTYSISAHYIREVYPTRQITCLPATPAFIIGLVNVRGKILTALDIRPLLDIKQDTIVENPFLIIVSINGVDIALLADTVLEVQQAAHDITPALSAVAGRGIAWVRGLDHNLNLLIDLPEMMADPRVIVNDEVT
jgi:purine-binding chemotaxis protein CheW